MSKNEYNLAIDRLNEMRGRLRASQESKFAELSCIELASGFISAYTLTKQLSDTYFSLRILWEPEYDSKKFHSQVKLDLDRGWDYVFLIKDAIAAKGHACKDAIFHILESEDKYVRLTIIDLALNEFESDVQPHFLKLLDEFKDDPVQEPWLRSLNVG